MTYIVIAVYEIVDNRVYEFESLNDALVRVKELKSRPYCMKVAIAYKWFEEACE